MTALDYEKALARLPAWMAVLGVIGTVIASRYAGIPGAVSFLIGSVGAWLNLRLIERGVNRIARLASSESGESVKVGAGTGVRIFIQFAVFVVLAFVILRFSSFNLKAVFLGFLVCPAAAIIEMVYELITYGHS